MRHRLACTAVLAATVALTAGALAHVATAQPRGDTLAVVVRIDDLQSRSTIAPRGLGAVEAVVSARGAKITWLVIPGRLDEAQNRDGVLAAELRASALRGHEIALHGYTHICPRCGQSDHEFYCARDNVSHADTTQQRLLDRGLALLSDRLGVTPATWVAPGHRADATTHRLLAARGLRVVSTTVAAEPTLDASQLNLRTSDDYAWSLTDGTYAAMRTAALRDARTRGRQQGYYVLLLHDPFTRPGYGGGITLRWMGEVLDSLRAQQPVRFLTMAETAAWLARPVTTDAPAAPSLPALAVTAAPSPARGGATVRITAGGVAPGADAIRAAVYDLLGRRVATLDDGPADAPVWTWDTSAVPPGVYTVRVETAGAHAIARVVVAR